MIISPSGKIKFKPNFKIWQNSNSSAENINLPENWWQSDHSYQTILKDKKNLKTIDIQDNLNKYSLPKPNYWEIKQGDYRKKCRATKNFYNIHIKKDLLSVSFTIAVIISALIIIAFSYLVSRI